MNPKTACVLTCLRRSLCGGLLRSLWMLLAALQAAQAGGPGWSPQPPVKTRPIFPQDRVLNEYNAPPRRKEDWLEDVRRSGRVLDEAAKKIEEFGTITMSAPVLAEPSGTFNFDLKHTSEKYFNDARTDVNAAIGSSEVVSQIFQGGAKVSADQFKLDAFRDKLQNFEAEKDQYQRARADREALYQNEVATVSQRLIQEVNLINQSDKTEEEKAVMINEAESRANDDKKKLIEEYYGKDLQAPEYPGTASADSPPTTDSSLLKDPSTARSKVDDLLKQAALGAVTGATVTVPNRNAIRIAQGDTAEQAIYRFLGNPNESNQFVDKKVLFGVCTVGVTPGWRSQRDYAADISIQTSYELQPARFETIQRLINDIRYPYQIRLRLARQHELPAPRQNTNAAEAEADTGKTPGVAATKEAGGALPGGQPSIPSELLKCNYASRVKNNKPVVAGVSPLMETQTLDLESRFRRQDEIALYLAAVMQQAGLTGQVEAFNQFVKNRQSDARSRTTSAVMSTTSTGGGLFGFQVGPRLQALADPASKKAGQGRVLERQSFPALIMFGLDHEDVRPVLDCNDQGEVEVYEPAIKLIQMTRWTNITPRFVERFVPWKPSTWFRSRWSESERMNYLVDGSLAMKRTDILPEDGDELFANGIHSTLKERFQHYSYQAVGAFSQLSIPVSTSLPQQHQFKKPEKETTAFAPEITQVIPESITASTTGENDADLVPAEHKFAVIGSGLKSIDEKTLKVFPATFMSEVKIVSKSDNLMIISGTLQKKGHTGGVFFFKADPKATQTKNSPQINTLPIEVKVIKKSGGGGGGNASSGQAGSKLQPVAVSTVEVQNGTQKTTEKHEVMFGAGASTEQVGEASKIISTGLLPPVTEDSAEKK
jgi:hypothetical protein